MSALPPKADIRTLSAQKKAASFRFQRQQSPLPGPFYLCKSNAGHYRGLIMSHNRILRLAALLGAASIISGCTSDTHWTKTGEALKGLASNISSDSSVAARPQYDYSATDFRNCVAPNPMDAGACAR